MPGQQRAAQRLEEWARQIALALADVPQGGRHWPLAFIWAPYALLGDPLR
ncbi:hypothetical protein [Paucibacter sp. DJ2R-2]|nr:hypothetical protein [Paucibacter sp. DJ2R-2]MCV2421633.1 hypothetical protein [Paucibacter sp. DJ4R-1]MCV2438338.1 hypothetical protein [Paucibacter sp. DJ2R-2]